MIKSIGLLVIGILIVDVAVIAGSFMQQSNKLTEAVANVSAMQSQVTALNGELVTLRGRVADLQSRLANSESNASNLQATLLASEAHVTNLQTVLLASAANATILQEQLINKAPTPDPISAPTPGAGPAAFTVSNLTITPGVIEPGNSVTVVVTVRNTGGQAGIYSLLLKIDEVSKEIQEMRTQNVPLAAGASQNVRLIVPFFEEGEFLLKIDNLAGIVEVIYFN